MIIATCLHLHIFQIYISKDAIFRTCPSLNRKSSDWQSSQNFQMIRVHLFISKNNFLNIQEWRLCSEEHVLESYTLKRASIWRQTVVVCACRHFVLNFWRPLRLCWRKHKLSQNSSKIRVYRDFLHNLLMWSTIQKKNNQHLLWPEKIVRGKASQLSTWLCNSNDSEPEAHKELKLPWGTL